MTPVAPYLYHVTRFRLGDATTVGTPMPAVHPDRGARTATSRTLAVKKWVGNGGTASTRPGSSRTSTRTTWTPQEGYAKMRVAR